MKPVIAIFDAGRTNKKLFLFDEEYNIVFQKTVAVPETVDEDGFSCESLPHLQSTLKDALQWAAEKNHYQIKTINFSAYGASLVHVDESGKAVAPLYDYLKPMPAQLQEDLYNRYGGVAQVAVETASPVLGSLNSGLQLYRLKKERPKTFASIQHSLHLPQFLSFLITGHACSDISSIGCHTALWNFEQNNYHQWVTAEGLLQKQAPLKESSHLLKGKLGAKNMPVGIGMHDSSAALVPYLLNFSDPFLLLSTGTWSIALNPFNNEPLQPSELEQDCLCYLSFSGKPVKAARFFMGRLHDEAVARIAKHFGTSEHFYKKVNYNASFLKSDPQKQNRNKTEEPAIDLNNCFGPDEAYHHLLQDLVNGQVKRLQPIMTSGVRRIFVDGGFAGNELFMHLLADALPQYEVFAASVPQASALGAALVLHSAWNKRALPRTLINLKFYMPAQKNAPPSNLI